MAYGGARALVTMKHVGLNVAADPFFSAAHTGVVGALVVVSADDPGMASSQNEQDNRRYAVAAAVPMLEPSDSQEAYDFTLAAIEISERWKIPVLLRVTTRVCHTQAPVQPRAAVPPPAPHFEHDLRGRNLIPANARPAHRRLRQKLSEMTEWSETTPLNHDYSRQQKTWHHHFRRLFHARPRSRAGRQFSQARLHASAAAEKNRRVRPQR